MNMPLTASFTASCLYFGTVKHRRIKPRAHKLRYRVFWMLLDLDELPQIGRTLSVFSLERFNLFGFYNADHGDGSSQPLRAQVETHLAAAGLDLTGGTICLLCMPRILGFVFNPISVYYCYRQDGGLAALLYEVHNTFGERHSYLIPVDAASRGPLEQQCAKAFYVSPFMDMEIAYTFRVQPPAERIALAIAGSDTQGPVIVASLAGSRYALTDAALLGAFVLYPLLTLKVIAGIHWEALKLWIKGMRLRQRPPPPAPVTIVRQQALRTPHV
ncbi:MAG: DUF1365 domain-containing protein [Pseudolabrys sp.]